MPGTTNAMGSSIGQQSLEMHGPDDGFVARHLK
jgi:hypothetical protein